MIRPASHQSASHSLFYSTPAARQSGGLRHAARNAAATLVLALLPLWSAHGHGGYDEEIQRAGEQISADPGNGTLWLHRGYLEFLHGAWQQSLIDRDQADRLAPGKLFTDYVRGQALAAGGKIEAGVAVLDDFIKAHGEYGAAYAARARLLLKLNRQQEATADFHAALERTANPEPDLYQETAETFAAQGHPEEAVKVLQSGIAKFGEIPQLVLKALDYELVTRQFDAALSRIAVMQKTAPRPEPWMAKRASVLAQAGRLAESRAAWTALRDHLASLPNLDRGSHAMSIIAEQAQQALLTLASIPTTAALR